MSRRTEAEHLADVMLAELLRAGAIPVITGGRLSIEGPARMLTAVRRERLSGCVPELRALVAGQWRSRETCVARRPCRRMSPCALPEEGRPCLIPPTCCVCEGPLPSGHRYLCLACADTPRASTSSLSPRS